MLPLRGVRPVQQHVLEQVTADPRPFRQRALQHLLEHRHRRQPADGEMEPGVQFGPFVGPLVRQRLVHAGNHRFQLGEMPGLASCAATLVDTDSRPSRIV